MAQTEERTGGSGDQRAAPLRAPAGRRWKRVGNRGGDRARSRHRRAPAFPALPARERAPASPDPAPSASTPSPRGPPLRSRPPSARLQGALFPPSPLGPTFRTPSGHARASPASLLRSRGRAPCASRAAALPPAPSHGSRPRGAEPPDYIPSAF
uniref:Uncharacterized protein n=1 Tax=Sciurus vulgaris TaxID=55149 RepID=A0A8D2DGB6_SCIVU